MDIYNGHNARHEEKYFKNYNTDLIELPCMQFEVCHGLYQQEHTVAQKFVVSVAMQCDLRLAGSSDDLINTVDYPQVYAIVREVMLGEHCNLLEHLADKIARQIFAKLDKIEYLVVSIEKCGAQMDDKSYIPAKITIKRDRFDYAHRVYLSLGSNMGDKKHNLKCALDLLLSSGCVTINNMSSIYQTKPVGYLEQDDFYNIVVDISTTCLPQELLLLCHQVEQQMGRVRQFANGPRTIDVDILLYDDLKICDDNLIVPHARMWQRGFVMVPLLEIAPQFVLNDCSEDKDNVFKLIGEKF